MLGVVITMGAIDGPPAEIGHKVGAALVGTFLGILLSYGFAQPLAGSLEQRVTEEAHYEQCIKAGLLAMYKGFPPVIAIEFARRVLPDELRPSFERPNSSARARKSRGGGRMSMKGHADHHHQEEERPRPATTAARGRWRTPTS